MPIFIILFLLSILIGLNGCSLATSSSRGICQGQEGENYNIVMRIPINESKKMPSGGDQSSNSTVKRESRFFLVNKSPIPVTVDNFQLDSGTTVELSSNPVFSKIIQSNKLNQFLIDNNLVIKQYQNTGIWEVTAWNEQ